MWRRLNRFLNPIRCFKTKAFQHVLVESVVKHSQELRIILEFLDVGGFFKGVFISNVLHQLCFNESAKPIPVEDCCFMFNLPMNR